MVYRTILFYRTAIERQLTETALETTTENDSNSMKSDEWLSSVSFCMCSLITSPSSCFHVNGGTSPSPSSLLDCTRIAIL
ncbi:hypothetical protein B0H34DRAFT_325051 [Crassisporium funariophilum]|nr:hypothetical protein B0H34DRAFT_325051 [Crassisporium funariophilum]